MERPEPETWLLWDDSCHSPALNMALDEALLLTAPTRGTPVLRFYGWDRPTVSIGYVQTYEASPHDRYAIVRRPTGGGWVYHDVDFTYTVAVAAGHWLTGLDRTRSYSWINRSVQDGLKRLRLGADLADADISHAVDRQTMVCFTNPTKYDILLADRKVAGSAQRRTKDGIVHQGSLHFGGPLPVPRCELGAALLEGFQRIMALTFAPFAPDAELLQLADQLAVEKYGSREWNQRR